MRPFLALRSYLPADHPDKPLEHGSEPTPAAFLAQLLDVTELLGRALAPHGSLAVELGDSFSGSGGAGGDYADDGWRQGQPRFGGSASKGRTSQWSLADAKWLAGVIDTEGSIMVHRQDRENGTPSYRADVAISMMDRQVCDQAALITGVGNVTRDGRNVYQWHASAQQARYVLLNIWPYLLIKQRQALAAIELQRHVEENRGRGRHNPLNANDIAHRQMIREFVVGLNGRGENRGVYVPTWEPPKPRRINHDNVGGTGWPLPKSLCFVPSLYGASLAYGRNLLALPGTPEWREFAPWRVRNLIAWVRPNPPVGALGDKWRPATSYITVATRSATRYWDDIPTRKPNPRIDEDHRLPPGKLAAAKSYGRDLDPDHVQRQNPAGAPLLDWWEITPTGFTSRLGAHYATFPDAIAIPLVEAMCPRRVCRTCGAPSRRQTETIGYKAGGVDIEPHVWESGIANGKGAHSSKLSPASGITRQAKTLGWSTCGCPGTEQTREDGFHEGLGWRPGLVLDPYAGTGTVGVVATGHGRDAILVDIDARNAWLAEERLGMFLQIIDPESAA